MSFQTTRRSARLAARMRRWISGAMALLMTATLAAPALQAGDYYGRGYQGGGYHGGYYGGENNWEWDDRGEYSDGGESGRSVGGSVGMAAGFLGGAALASAVVSAGAVAAMGPMAGILIGSAITLGGGFLGAKLFSNLGQTLTRKLGKENMWMMIGATAGTIAAIALIPALGPFAGAGGLIIKGLVGGIAGGVIGRLFADQLEALATPRMLMTGVGALVGGLAGNVPGAIAGAAGGYALGAIFDDHFFAEPGDSVRNYLPDLGGLTDGLRGAKDRVTDWVDDKWDDANDSWDRNWYDKDPYYRHGYTYARGPEPYHGNPFDTYYNDYQYGAYGDASSYDQYRGDYRNFVDGMESGAYNPNEIRALYERQGQSWRGYRGY